MKPLEFKIEYIPQLSNYCIVFYYEDGTMRIYKLAKFVNDIDVIEDIGLEKENQNESRHYFIGDLYGYQVKNDREGL